MMVQITESQPPSGRPGSSPSLLVSGWLNPGCCRHLDRESVNERSLPVSFLSVLLPFKSVNNLKQSFPNITFLQDNTS